MQRLYCSVYSKLNVYSFPDFPSPYSSEESDEFSGIPKPKKRRNESKECEPRRNIASGTTTGFKVFLSYSRSEDSLRGQRDKSGARVSSFNIITGKSSENLA